MSDIDQAVKIRQLEALLMETREQLRALRTNSKEDRIEDAERGQIPAAAAVPVEEGSTVSKRSAAHEPPQSSYHPRSTPLKTFEFDVFLSFSGKDTRKGFTSHLYYALDGAGVRTFFDQERLEGGDIIDERLQNAIKGSAIAIPIFSTSYAASRSCMMELAKIVECNGSILPIFYDIDPSSVRKQKGVYETAFQHHADGPHQDSVEEWRKALRTAADRVGYDLHIDANGSEAEVVQMVVAKVQDELHCIRQLPLLLSISEMWGTAAMACHKQIMDALEDPNVHKIGVWGMGLVGKTAIVQHVHNQLLQNASNQEFDLILFVQVPYEATVKQIRDEIKRQVCPRVSLADIGGNKSSSITMLIKNSLEGTKFLLILDDLWKGVDLQSLGVPEPNRDNGCKLLLTTRNLEICGSMGTQADVKVMPLRPLEAWDFFCERVGGIPDCLCDCVAKEIVVSCGGLPGGLLMAAEHLRNCRTDHANYVWTKARDALRSFRPLNQEMERGFHRLRWSYDRLESPCLKDIFMAAAFHIPRYDRLFTTEVLISSTTLGFRLYYEGLNGDKMEDESRLLARRDVYIDKLEKTCMVEQHLMDNGQLVVRINELIRSMAIQLKGDQWVYSNYRRLKDVQQLQARMEKAERVTLRTTSITTLPERPRCPRLISLSLVNNFITHIPDTFFEEMKRLRVLILEGTHINTLPLSLSNLIHLRTLMLWDCPLLKSIEGVGRLKMLLCLGLRGTAIEGLPTELSELSKLTLLDLTDTRHLTRIPGGVMPKLCSLEMLHMKGSAYVWSGTATPTSARLQELQSLSCLHGVQLVVARKKDLELIKCAYLSCYVQESKETVLSTNVTVSALKKMDPATRFSFWLAKTLVMH